MTTRARDQLVRPPAIVALAIYALAALLLFGRPLFAGGHQCLCVDTTTDEGIFAWAMEWWPHALLHGLNPFYTHILYAPEGFDLARGALVPGAALVLTPVTAIAGPLFSFNLAMLLCPILAAFFAFLLCRRLTGAFWPSLLGGWLFGFSTYMFGQLTGHLDLTLVFLVPAIVHLFVRALAGEISRRRFVALLVLALVLQFSFSVEIFATFTLFAAIALVIAYVIGDREIRARLRALLGPTVLSYLATALIVSPYLYYALKPGGLPVLSSLTDRFSNDLLGFVLPTPITQIGGDRFAATTNLFTGGIVEGSAYLGPPLILLLALAVVSGWRRVEVRTMAWTFALVLLLSLGGVLHVGGHASIPLPWAAVNHLPVLGLALPARFILYGFLIASVLTATWLARNQSRPGAWLLALLSVAALWPAIGRDFWRSKPDLPSLFTTSAYHRAFHPRDTVLVLPVGIDGNSMLYQAEAHLGFTMASGYVVPPQASDPYKDDPIYPTLTYDAAVPRELHAASSFLVSHHITVAALDSFSAMTSPWVALLERLGWVARTVDDVVLLRPGIPEPAQPSPPPSTPIASGPPFAQRAAQRVVGQFFRALAAGNAAAICAALSPAARATEAERRDAGEAACTHAVQPILKSAGALRRELHARIGLATIAGTHGYVAVTVASSGLGYLAVHEIAGRWRVDATKTIPAP